MIDVDEEYSGVVVEKLSERRAELVEMRPVGRRQDAARLPRPDARPDRLSVEFLTDTRGTGVMNRVFHGYAPYKGDDPGPPHRRADLQFRRRGASPTRCGTSRTAARCSSTRATRSIAA